MAIFSLMTIFLIILTSLLYSILFYSMLLLSLSYHIINYSAQGEVFGAAV